MMENSLFIKKQFFCDSKKQQIQKYYDLQEELGKGTYGVVYKAKLKNKEKTFRAIKKIFKNNIRNINQFISEIQILKELDHPNVIKLYQTFQNDGFLYLVTDLFEGRQLFHRLNQKGQFNESEARQIFMQILQAVNYCHLHNVCHRDLKPQNLLFLDHKSLNLKLIDFGLAFKWKSNMKTEIKTKRQNCVVGTPYYIAPKYSKDSMTKNVIFGLQGSFCTFQQRPMRLLVVKQKNRQSIKLKDSSTRQIVLLQTYQGQQTQNLSIQLKDLIRKILVPLDKRISLQQIFDHSWIVKKNPPKKQLKLNFKKLSKFSKFSKIKTIAVTYIASQMGEKDIQKLGQLFRSLDTNHDGYQSVVQIQTAVKKQKQKINGDQLQQLFAFIDTDKNGKINYTQFISSCLQNSIVYKQENLLSVFRMLDKDNNGSISINELKSVLKQQKFESNHKAVQQIMRKCDKKQRLENRLLLVPRKHIRPLKSNSQSKTSCIYQSDKHNVYSTVKSIMYTALKIYVYT